MSLVRICDRCGKKLLGDDYKAERSYHNKVVNGGIEIDFCAACDNDFRAWIRKFGKEKEDIIPPKSIAERIQKVETGGRSCKIIDLFKQHALDLVPAIMEFKNYEIKKTGTKVKKEIDKNLWIRNTISKNLENSGTTIGDFMNMTERDFTSLFPISTRYRQKELLTYIYGALIRILKTQGYCLNAYQKRYLDNLEKEKKDEQTLAL